MSSERQNLEPEIAHILSIDVVAYSKLLVNEQIELLNELKHIVRETKCSCTAEANGQLIRLPTGDGMVLLFFRSPEEPLQCAVEITEALQAHPHIQVRMGAHSGPVNKIQDVNDRPNVAGAGMNVAQRVLDCGDAGHILLSQHLAADLAEYSHWRPHLHDLGECVVKHGFKLHLVNFHNGSVGNPDRPLRLREADTSRADLNRKAATSRRRVFWLGALALLLLMAAVATFMMLRGAPKGTPEVPEKSVAILPFENWSDESKDSYFADGVQGEILTLLMKVRDLKVISRTSVMKYSDVGTLDLKQVAHQLGVRYFLEGNVQRAGPQVRVGAQLVDGLTGTQLWANSYDRDLADVFGIQTEIAEKIVTQLAAKFTAEEKAAVEERPTSDLVAYDLYLQGKALMARVAFESSRTDDLEEAARLFQEATERDPAFYLAYCQLANAHDQTYFYAIDHTPRRLSLAQAAVDAAVRLRPDAGETHLASANHYYFSRDYDRSLKEVALAEQKLPNDPQPILVLGYIDRRQGKWKTSTQHLERALELDPRNLVFLKQVAQSYSALHRYTDQRRIFERALAIAPDDAALQVQRAAVEFDARGDTHPMHEAIATVLAKDPAAGTTIADMWYQLALCEGDVASASRALGAMKPSAAYEESVPYPKSWCEGLIARLRNDPAAARTAFAAARVEVSDMVDAQPEFAEGLSALGMLDAALGNKAGAIREGERAVELLPPSKDAVVGAMLLQNLSNIHAWTDEKAAALRELKEVTSMPSYLSYGLLLRHPAWAPLRDEPGFKEILASLAASAL
jgi:TolB-like protein/class 3 adenylate cyclase/Tfp pilus assembly protein PilF